MCRLLNQSRQSTATNASNRSSCRADFKAAVVEDMAGELQRHSECVEHPAADTPSEYQVLNIWTLRCHADFEAAVVDDMAGELRRQVAEHADWLKANCERQVRRAYGSNNS